LVVGYLSFRTFSEKQQALRNFLESNLWIMGEATLEAIEDELLNIEESALKKEMFAGLLKYKTSREDLSEFLTVSDEIRGRPFLLDENFEIILPRTRRLDASDEKWVRDLSESPFSRALQSAESFEFSQMNYSRALEGYNLCLSMGASKNQKASFLEAMGRCFQDNR
jgi:hypothetical protein